MNTNAIYVIWKSPKNRRNYTVGKITKDQEYMFNYETDLDAAQEAGFNLFIPFADPKLTYSSKILFPIFATRLPDRKRPDINDILKKYKLSKYDDFELLKCGAELPTDTLRFVKAINSISELDGFIFNIAGPRHYLGCENQDCENASLTFGDIDNTIVFKQDKMNPQDKNAIQVIYNNRVIGYVPRYYTNMFNNAFAEGLQIHGKIVSFNKESRCDNCIEVKTSLN